VWNVEAESHRGVAPSHGGIRGGKNLENDMDHADHSIVVHVVQMFGADFQVVRKVTTLSGLGWQ
jgi:hypothetical protein